MADGLFDFFSGGSFPDAPQSYNLPDLTGGGGSLPLQDFTPQPSTPDALGTSMTGGPTLSTGDPASGVNWASLIPAAIPAATGILGLFKNQGGAGDKALKQQYQATQPLQNASNAALNAYSTGTLRPSDQALVDQRKRAYLAAMQQQLAQMGIPVGSAQADIQDLANQRALADTQQFLNNYIQQGTTATGITASNLTNYAREQMVADQQQRQQWAQLMAELGKLGTQVDWGSLFS